MLAAADHAQDSKVPPPPELELAFTCHRWNSLPESGGVLDQPAGLLRRMSAVENIYNSFKALEKANDYARFGDENPVAVKIIESIYALRKERGDEDTVVSVGTPTGGEHGG